MNFVMAHYKDAATVARTLNVPTEMILGLSAAESQWGEGPFVRGNNFFGQHASKYVPFQLGTIKAAQDGQMSTFASYLEAARSFAAMHGHAVRGITDPTVFAQALVHASFNTSNKKTGGRENYASYTAGIINATRRRLQSIK